jgi:hypothetical protein
MMRKHGERMSPTVLYEDEWVTLSFDTASGVVCYRRSAAPYGTPADIERSYAGVREVAERLAPGLKLLLDIRLAPPRNDAAFEARANGAIDAFVARFVKHATLVRTAVGKLQSVRLAHERGAEPHVFDEEGAALDYLAAGAADPRAPRR